MDKEQSAVKSFLEGTSNESMFDKVTDPFEIPLESAEEVIEPEVKEEKPIPFNKDPKVLKFIEKEVQKKLQDFKPEPEKKSEVNDDDDYYARLIGNDTPEKREMVKEAKAREERQLQIAEERAFNRLSQKEQEEQRFEKEAQEELDNAFESIEETYDVDISSNNPQARKTRQEFVSFVEKIAPKNKNGDIVDYPDMNSAWETFNEIKKSTTQPSRAKELASRGLTRSSETTIKDAKRVDWNAVEDMMDTLK